MTNNTPAMPVEMHIDPPNCGDTAMTESSVNIHYHGTNTSPNCHWDEVIHTVINSGHTFAYNVQIPADEPPGLYWYHPHIHGHVEAALQGGGSGAIVVEGIEDFQHAVAAMRQMIIVVRDQNVAGDPLPGGNVPSWDLYVKQYSHRLSDRDPSRHPDASGGATALARIELQRGQYHRSAGSVRWHDAEAPNRRPRRRSHRIAGRHSAREDREIAEHEDDGMMAIVRVVPAIASARLALAPKASIGADLARRK
jgi:FtsP/CotA-like multicopper oxidase with cupredoxin domain